MIEKTEIELIDFGVVRSKEIIIPADVSSVAKFNENCLIKLPKITSKNKVVTCLIYIELIKKCNIKLPKVLSYREDEFLNSFVPANFIDEINNIGEYVAIYRTYDNGNNWYGYICKKR